MQRGQISKRRRRARLSAISPGGAWSTSRGRVIIAEPGKGILARQREVKALVELRVPFELNRQQIDDVERGANDSDWQPAKDAAQKIAYAEDRAIFEGYPAAGIGGSRQGTSNPIMTLPADVRHYPDATAPALNQLPRDGRSGP